MWKDAYQRLNRITLRQLKILIIAFIVLVLINGIAGRGPAIGGKGWWLSIAGAICFFARHWYAAIRERCEEPPS